MASDRGTVLDSKVPVDIVRHEFQCPVCGQKEAAVFQETPARAIQMTLQEGHFEHHLKNLAAAFEERIKLHSGCISRASRMRKEI